MKTGASLGVPFPAVKFLEKIPAIAKALNLFKIRTSNFASSKKLRDHFELHGGEFGARTSSEYLNLARNTMENGIKIRYKYNGEFRTGYVNFMGLSRQGKTIFSKRTVKFAFVGTNKNGKITTLHTKSGEDLWRTLNGNVNNKTIRPIE